MADLTLLDLLNLEDFVRDQDAYFHDAFLRELFSSKIVRSQATGKDGVRVPAFEGRLAAEAQLIARKVSAGTYRFTTYKERLILRGANREPRQISIPTVRDRLTLRAICQLLHDHIPATRGVTPHTLVKRVVAHIREGDHTASSFVRIDVENFFPSLSHVILQRELRKAGVIPLVQNLCLMAITNPTGSPSPLPDRGVPQGLSISGALAALYMLRFDEQQLRSNPSYFRYVDDILYICPTKDAETLLRTVSAKLKARGLKIHAKGVAGKTEISPVEDGVDFLGYKITRNEVSIRETSYKRMFKNLQGVLTDFKHRRDTEKTLFRLNLKITGCIVDNRRRGWMMFFSYTECLSQLKFLDIFIDRQLAKIGFPIEKRRDVKRFVKSHHEIKFNLNQTSYIPNFDQFDVNQMTMAISAMTRHTTEEIATWDIERVQREFGRVIAHEVQDLERDVGSPS